MTKISNPDILFFNELFNDQVYRIREKKYAPERQAKAVNMVKEETADYLSLPIDFKGITSDTLILFNYPGAEAIPAGDKSFLDQVLKAAGRQFENLSWLNTASLDERTRWVDIAKQSPSECVIAFGVDTRYLPDRIADGWVNKISGKKAICASALAEISNDSGKKKLLWQGLKEIYGL
jgi:hypothetical protein